jgi:uncharacterized membrane protein
MNSRWLLLALIVSLGMNLLIVGVVAGRAMSNRTVDGPFPSHLGWMLKEVDQATRQNIRPMLDAHDKKIRPIRRQMRRAQHDARSLLKQPEFDEQALAESFQKLRSVSDQYQTEMHGMMIEILSNLDADQRQQAASFLNRGMGGPPNKSLRRPQQNGPSREGPRGGSRPE